MPPALIALIAWYFVCIHIDIGQYITILNLCGKSLISCDLRLNVTLCMAFDINPALLKLELSNFRTMGSIFITRYRVTETEKILCKCVIIF